MHRPRSFSGASIVAASLCAGLLARPFICQAQDTTKVRPESVSVDSTHRGAATATKAGAAGKRRVKRKRDPAELARDSVAIAAGWPVAAPDPLPGSVLPATRIVAFYGNPLSKRMGILGELPPDEMLRKLDREVEAWRRADSTMSVEPALQLIVATAQPNPGRDGKYRQRMDTALIERVYGWAQRRNALLFLDVQVGQSTIQEELPRLIPFLRRPNVHLAIDPEFSMKHGEVPGTKIGTLDAADVNYAASVLATLVTTDSLPPKVLVVHRFTRDMLTHYRNIALDPRVQVVIDMDGWGPPSLKRESYRAYVARYPVEYTGFKLFYHNDTKGGDKLMTPAEVLRLFPRPMYIQYQ